MRGASVAHSVEWPTLDLGLGHHLQVLELSLGGQQEGSMPKDPPRPSPLAPPSTHASGSM